VQFVDDGIGQVEGAWAEAEDGDDLGGSVDRRPDPDVVVSLADMGPEFIELNMRTLQVLKEVRVEILGLEAGAGEPGTQGAFADAPDPFEDGDVHAFRQEGQGFGHAGGVGFQAVENRIAADREFAAAGLTA